MNTPGVVGALNGWARRNSQFFLLVELLDYCGAVDVSVEAGFDFLSKMPTAMASNALMALAT
ncbi:hypothetical protein [Pseudomonas sp. NPDC090592]|uniref:hypothetical protein n=1 Tax=Pseudomonas sp. NPDC090592 TaxID=3364480 RepID=UPI00383AE9E0